MTTRTRFAGVLTAIAMTAALAACSSSSDMGTMAGTSDAAAGDVDAPSSEASSAPMGSDSTMSDRSALSSQVSPKATASDEATPAQQRAVISTGTVSLRSPDVAQARRDVQRVVDAQQGSVSEENTETDDDGTTSYARLVVRVPSAKFAAAMTELETTAELRASNRGSEDVTTQVIDTEVRVRAQQASLRRVELLLSRAQSIKDIIWIESQLTTRQAELDSLKSQQSWLKDQTSLSTITVDITTVSKKEAEKKDKDEAGFLVGLTGGMKALAGAGSALATIAGALLPFAVLLALLGFPLWLLRRRLSAGRTARTQSAP